ncbi:MAG: succinate dehydrogenase [Chitinophagia bacterium]|nr:succinate dehydrogenase [Chitinophagia bacterium]
MSWKNQFSSSIGKKIQMSLTGLFLIVFLIVHCYVNAQIFYNDNGKSFNEAAHFMGTNFIIRSVEIGLFAFLFLHIIQGLSLYFKNKSKRPVKYAVSAGNATSKWYSRSMAILGTLILMFLIVHLAHFWVPNRYEQTFSGHEKDLFIEMKNTFANPLVVLIYVLGCISLAWHLVHGFYSAFQTLGLNAKKYKSLIQLIGIGFSIIVPLIFMLMPIAIHLGMIK